MGVERFEDLIAWQKAKQLAQEISVFTRQGDFSRDFGLSGQMQRAAVSVMSNIAEGFERVNYPEFRNFLSMAKGSCGELRAQLHLALDIGYITKEEFRRLKALAEEVSRVIVGLHASVGTLNKKNQRK